MSKYLGSPRHKENLNKARKQAMKQKKTCPHCLEMFSAPGFARHERLCKFRSDNRPDVKICQVCSNEFIGDSETCGYSCANSLFRSGPDHPGWKEESYRSTCFHYHDKKCVVCGESNLVEVHHMDEDRANNDPSNLIPLCPTHHQYWHSRYRHMIENVVTNYVREWSLKQRVSQR